MSPNSVPRAADASVATAAMPALSVRDLRVEYATPAGSVAAVRGASFDVAAGQRLGIVGESGSGKSSLALALMGLMEPPGRVAGGTVSLSGKEISGLSDRRLDEVRGRDISLIFQDPMSALDPVKRIGSQLTEGMRRHQPELSRSAAKRRAIELLAEVEIPRPEQFVERFPHEYSGGMRQRVMIAIALANEPSVIVADEPTTALDVTTQAQILALLDRLVTERGATVVLITHNFAVVAEFCDLTSVMYAGEMVEHGTTEALFSRPCHPYTRALLECILRPGQDPGAPLAAIPGIPPNLADLPSGCAFAPRCARAEPVCSAEHPPREETETGFASCHFTAESADQGESS